MSRKIDDELCDAAEKGDVAEIERLVAAGANPNAVRHDFEDEYYPIERAAVNGHIAAIAALLKAGAHVDRENSYMTTALMLAAWYARTDSVVALIDAGADVNHVNNNGETALHYSTINGHVGATRVLLEAGAEIEVSDTWGGRPSNRVRCWRGWSCVRVRVHAPSRPGTQVCSNAYDKTVAGVIHALLDGATSWGRRRTAALACYSGTWEE